MGTVIAMGLCAALFVVFTLLFPRRKCEGKCPGCTSACEFAGRRD